MAHLVTVIEALLQRQVGFRLLCDGAIDTTTTSGELVFMLFLACDFTHLCCLQPLVSGILPVLQRCVQVVERLEHRGMF
jgi:hypothetical protein